MRLSVMLTIKMGYALITLQFLKSIMKALSKFCRARLKYLPLNFKFTNLPKRKCTRDWTNRSLLPIQVYESRKHGIYRIVCVWGRGVVQSAAEKKNREKWGFWEKEHGLENKLSILGLAVRLLIIYGELQINCAVDSEATLQTLWGANKGL